MLSTLLPALLLLLLLPLLLLDGNFDNKQQISFKFHSVLMTH